MFMQGLIAGERLSGLYPQTSAKSALIVVNSYCVPITPNLIIRALNKDSFLSNTFA